MVAHNDAVFRAASEAAREILSDETSTAGQNVKQAAENKINVGVLERDISIAAGAALGIAALTKPISLRGLVLAGLGGALLYRGISGNCGLYRALGINTTKPRDEPSAEPETYSERGIHIEQAVTVDRPAADLFAYWRTLSNLPAIMTHLKEVRVTDNKRSHWIAKAPLGFSLEWDAEIINEESGKLIAWQSVGDAMVPNSGSVRFIENDKGGTEVRVVLEYLPPAGQLGSTIARLFGDVPGATIRLDLEEFRKRMETSAASTSRITGL